MNWITNFVRPKIKSLWAAKSDAPDNLWRKCTACGGMIFHRDLEAANYVCMHCDHHMKIGGKERLASLFDDGLYQLLVLPDVPFDPLKFRDEKRYVDRIKDARAKTGDQDALKAAVGEGLVAAMRHAAEERTPFVLFSAAGGARMQEGILSLMQMPRTTIAVQ